MLTENVIEVEKHVQAACDRAGRSRDEVTLIAVSKTKPVEMLSTRANTMLMAVSRASMVSLRTEFLEWFISIVLPCFGNRGAGNAKRPPL